MLKGFIIFLVSHNYFSIIVQHSQTKQSSFNQCNERIQPKLGLEQMRTLKYIFFSSQKSAYAVLRRTSQIHCPSNIQQSTICL